MSDNTSPIGVFDSGLGGISVLKKLIEVMPYEDFVYFGDSKNAPYGVKTTEDVRNLTIQHVEELLSIGCKALCIACNTATSAAVRDLRQIYPNIPLVGIEPAIKPACESKKNAKVLVMATPMTIREEKFQSLLARFKNDATIYQLPCPGLMEFIESGILSGKRLDGFLKQLLWDYIGSDIDSVVLGCTHYPFVKDEIKKVLGNNVKVFDGSLGTAKELKRRIIESNLAKPESDHHGVIKILNSDPDHIPLAEKLLK